MIIEKDILNLKRKAESGNIEALLDLGEAYIKGTGIEMDKKRGQNLIIKAFDDVEKLREKGLDSIYYAHLVGKIFLDSGNKYRAAQYFSIAIEEILFYHDITEYDKYVTEFNLESLIKDTGFGWTIRTGGFN